MQIETREREAAISVVEMLVEADLCQNLAMNKVADWFENSGLYHSGFYFSDGMTKLCFFHPSLGNCVIKVGFSNYIDDYARIEFENYQAAIAENLAYYFPYTDFLCEYEGVSFFIQEIAECDEDAISCDWHDKLVTFHEEIGDEFDLDFIWEEVYDLGDSEKIELMFNDLALMHFLKKNRIGDLHEGNFGFIGDRIVIIDFSGYHG